jgi:hypothetical protein
MRKSCPTTMKKRQKYRYLLGKAGVTPDEGEKTLSFIDNRIISSPEVAGDRLADSKNDLFKSAGIIEKFDIFHHIRNSQKNPSIPKAKTANTGP